MTSSDQAGPAARPPVLALRGEASPPAGLTVEGEAQVFDALPLISTGLRT